MIMRGYGGATEGKRDRREGWPTWRGSEYECRPWFTLVFRMQKIQENRQVKKTTPLKIMSPALAPIPAPHLFITLEGGMVMLLVRKRRVAMD
jgi:hypothetical protein